MLKGDVFTAATRRSDRAAMPIKNPANYWIGSVCVSSGKGGRDGPDQAGGYPISARSTSSGGWLETPRLVNNPITTVKVVADALAISNGRRVGA